MNLKLVLQLQAKCDAREFPLREDSCSIGRKRDNELIIEEFCVSGYHAKVYRTETGDYEVTDLDSSEGTFLNRKRLSCPAKIKVGDVLRLGIIEMAVHEFEEEVLPVLSPCEAGDGIIRFDEIPFIEDLDPGLHELEELEKDPSEALAELEAAKEAAEEETRKLREELSRVREESRRRNSDDESELSSLISELEYSLEAEKFLTDAVKGKNEEFRSKIELLTVDLGHAQEEISRLKATNTRQLPLPEGGEEKFAKLKEELTLSHENNADQQAELTDLQLELATLKGEMTNREIELLEKEQSEARIGSAREKQLQGRIAQLEATIAETEAAAEPVEVSRPLEEMERRLEAAEKAARSSVQRESALEVTNAELTEKLEAAEGRVSDLEARMEEGASSDSQNATLIGDLKEKLASAEAEAQETREQLEASQDQLSDIEVLLSAKSNLATEQATEIEELRKELSETKRSFTSSGEKREREHRDELDTLEKELKVACEESEQRKKEVESLQSDLDSLRESTAEERNQQIREQETRLSLLEEDLALSVERCCEIESARDALEDTLKKRDERIAGLIETRGNLESKLEGLEEEKAEISSLLRNTREGLSGALHSSRTTLVRTTRELEAEILRRVRLENLLRKSEEARKGLRSEIEALEAESEDGVVLTPEVTGFPGTSPLTEQQAEELQAFEARMASLHPPRPAGQHADAGASKGFNRVDFYRQLVEKLDLIDDLILRYDNRWRFAKIVKQLVVLKESFLELLEAHSVDLLNLEPGTPLCMNQSNRLELIPLEDGTEPKIDPFGNTAVLETVCPGYIFHDGSRDLVIRKARVKVG